MLYGRTGDNEMRNEVIVHDPNTLCGDLLSIACLKYPELRLNTNQRTLEQLMGLLLEALKNRALARAMSTYIKAVSFEFHFVVSGIVIPLAFFWLGTQL